ncbi:MAG: hypothetical protein LBM77_05830 [Spirochaetaceae bacterium]|jgi:hypothetical protein|nr:hypothetical protein [Spirochaetaceae bacterium]
MDQKEETNTAEDSLLDGKIYCANCMHCKLVPQKTDDKEKFVMRIRCDAGKWKKKLGEEKFYKYGTVLRRSFEQDEGCDTYEEMGDIEPLVDDLKKLTANVNKDETYTLVPGYGLQADI